MSSIKCSFDPRLHWEFTADYQCHLTGSFLIFFLSIHFFFLKLLTFGLKLTFSMWKARITVKLNSRTEQEKVYQQPFTTWGGITEESDSSQKLTAKGQEEGILPKLQQGKISQDIKKKLCTMTTAEHWKRGSETLWKEVRDVVKSPSLQIFTAELEKAPSNMIWFWN